MTPLESRQKEMSEGGADDGDCALARVAPAIAKRKRA